MRPIRIRWFGEGLGICAVANVIPLMRESDDFHVKNAVAMLERNMGGDAE